MDRQHQAFCLQRELMLEKQQLLYLPIWQAVCLPHPENQRPGSQLILSPSGVHRSKQKTEKIHCKISHLCFSRKPLFGDSLEWFSGSFENEGRNKNGKIFHPPFTEIVISPTFSRQILYPVQFVALHLPTTCAYGEQVPRV